MMDINSGGLNLIDVYRRVDIGPLVDAIKASETSLILCSVSMSHIPCVLRLLRDQGLYVSKITSMMYRVGGVVIKFVSDMECFDEGQVLRLDGG